MRTIFLTLFSLLLINPAMSQIRADAGLAYGTQVNNPGMSIGVEVFIEPEISINPGLIIFFEDAGIYDDRDWWEINIDGHYYFASESLVDFYGLAGLNITTRAIRLAEARDADTEVGLNLGVGMNYRWKDHLHPFTSIKYVASKSDQAVFTLGLRFGIQQ